MALRASKKMLMARVQTSFFCLGDDDDCQWVACLFFECLPRREVQVEKRLHRSLVGNKAGATVKKIEDKEDH
jgi:hypothetical protein